MTPIEIMEARLAELRKESDAAYEARGAIIDKAASEKRGMTDLEQAAYDEAGTKRSVAEKDIPQVEARLSELREQAKREAASDETRRLSGDTGSVGGGGQVTDPPVYISSGANGNSFLRDLSKRTLGQEVNNEATDRLRRNTAMVLSEKRALGNTNTTGGSGGEFAPPQWMVDEFINIARPGRVTADLFKHAEVPAGISSVNLPKLLTGTSVALQTSQNTALAQVDATTAFVSTGFSVLGGKQVVSQMLIDQSAIPFDQVILADLAAAYATQIGTQAIIGAGTGANNNAVINGLQSAVVPAGNQILFTSATPTAQQFYGVAANAISAFVTSRFAPPTAWLMHPRRWFWLASKSDTQGRPLVVPAAYAYNPMAVNPQATVQGPAGEFLGLPVYIDPNLPINRGAGTNQDDVYLLKQDDLWLFESTPQVEAFREPYADSVGVLLRIYAYVGTILNRRPNSIATITGTGLVTPVFG